MGALRTHLFCADREIRLLHPRLRPVARDVVCCTDKHSSSGCPMSRRVTFHRAVLALQGFVLVSCLGSTVAALRAESALTFEKHIRPILKAHCFHCHGEEESLHGELDLRLVRLIKQGGDSGSAIETGDASASLLWQRIESDEMPEGPKKLTSSQKLLIRQWIDQGAKTARPEPKNVDDARFSVEELSHWAYQPIRSVPIPSAKGMPSANVVDLFIERRLRTHGLTLSERASAETLLRRVTFGLTGLPPTPDEVDAFLADTLPGGYARMVDRLLASPQFGVRWGRHWLDVAGYAETNGDPRNDTKREYAWRYRDYVINAVNAGMPIDQFYVEQLAGDELIADKLDVNNQRQLELLAATGFLRMAPDTTQSDNSLANRNAAVAESMKVVSSSMLGVSVGCAQCHDHKYDPIGIDDYYRLRAVFDPAFPLENWQQPQARLVDFTTPETQAEIDAIEARAKALDDDMQARRKQVAEEILEKKFADVPDSDREATRQALATAPSERTPRQKDLLDAYPMVKPINHILGLLVEYDSKAYVRFQKEAEKIAEIRATKPARRMVMATRERPDVIPESKVFFRGDPESPRDTVQPGELAVVATAAGTPDFEATHGDVASTGRRLAYARHLTSGRHPLAARVFVNRVWLHHMGRGLVATPNDFGISGERPSHPELLDWLAKDFMDHGWDPKRLHRKILLSATYQQVARRSNEGDQQDPENALFGRANLRRLEAEAVRDAILHVTGRLDDALGGASIPVTENAEGKVVVGRRKIRNGLKAGVDDKDARGARRSVYIEVQRQSPLNVLATFDQPDMTPNCDQRRFTTVATQALWLLNDSHMLMLADHLAGLILAEASTETERIDRLFVRLFAMHASVDEQQACLTFLSEQGGLLNSTKAERKERASWAALCQVLIASNRFLYVD